MKSIALQSDAELGGPLSVLARQRRDHVELDRLLRRLDATPPGLRGPVLRDIYRLVFPHAFAEEAVLWPVMRRVLSDGEELTLRVEQEHQRIDELVTRLEALGPSSPEHRQFLDRIVELLREDVRDEEDLLLPRLQERLSPARLRALGLAWEAVRRIAPTRAHAVVARRPPGNVLAALPLTLLDRSRDRLEAIAERGGRVGPPSRAVAATLARSSRAVEHLPGMSRGEDRSTRRVPNRGGGWTIALVGIAVAGAAAAGVQRRRRRRAATRRVSASPLAGAP